MMNNMKAYNIITDTTKKSGKESKTINGSMRTQLISFVNLEKQNETAISSVWGYMCACSSHSVTSNSL